MWILYLSVQLLLVLFLTQLYNHSGYKIITHTIFSINQTRINLLVVPFPPPNNILKYKGSLFSEIQPCPEISATIFSQIVYCPNLQFSPFTILGVAKNIHPPRLRS